MESFSLNGALKTFTEITGNPKNFDKNEDVSKDVINNIKLNIKGVYDHTKEQGTKSQSNNSVSKLWLKGLDSEQIWQQIEIHNENVLPNFINEISVLLVNKNKLIFKNLEKENDKSDSDSVLENASENADDSEDYTDKEEINQSTNDTTKIYVTKESSSDNDDGEEYTNQKKQASNRAHNSVEDEFFKLSEMENFLNTQEKLSDQGDGNDSDDSEKEGSVDLFKGNDDADSEEGDEAKTARFKDYFVAKDETKKKPKTNKLLEELENDDELDSDEEIESEEEFSNKTKSSLQLRQEFLKNKIDRLEKQAISGKPWQLKGEITAENRPQNSLLEEIVGFDLTARPAPVITEQTSLQLEDIIRQRIKDKVFDNVERKIKPVETPLELKKRLVLDHEKSKQSLAQIYEQQYSKQQAALDPANSEQPEEEPELHKEVKLSMRNLFTKLDALSNFHFTSKPAVPELKITSHLPAINMEEVAPVAASEATLLAPEEIKSKHKILNNKLRKKKKNKSKPSKKPGQKLSKS